MEEEVKEEERRETYVNALRKLFLSQEANVDRFSTGSRPADDRCWFAVGLAFQMQSAEFVDNLREEQCALCQTMGKIFFTKIFVVEFVDNLSQKGSFPCCQLRSYWILITVLKFAANANCSGMMRKRVIA